MDCEKIKAKLLSQVEAGPNNCWMFSGSISSHGYGQTMVDRKNWRAHRLAWSVLRGEIPRGLMVLHRCHVKRCINPEHLYLGTAADNMRDAIENGDQPLGDLSPNARVTREDVAELRRLRSDGLSYSALAERFGIGKTTCRDIIDGRTWKYV